MILDASPGTTDYTRELRQVIAEALHAQLPGCTHDEHGNDCAGLGDAVMAAIGPQLVRWKAAGAQAVVEAIHPAKIGYGGPDHEDAFNEAHQTARRVADNLAEQEAA